MQKKKGRGEGVNKKSSTNRPEEAKWERRDIHAGRDSDKNGEKERKGRRERETEIKRRKEREARSRRGSFNSIFLSCSSSFLRFFSISAILPLHVPVRNNTYFLFKREQTSHEE